MILFVQKEKNNILKNIYLASLLAQTVKRLPAMRETRVRFLGREDPLEKEMAIHCSTLAWKIPWTEEPDRLPSRGLQRVRHDWATSLYTLLFNFIETKRIFIREEGFQFNVPFTSPWASLVTQIVKNPPAHAGNSSLIPGLGRCPGEGKGNPFQYFCLGNPMHRGVW